MRYALLVIVWLAPLGAQTISNLDKEPPVYVWTVGKHPDQPGAHDPLPAKPVQRDKNGEPLPYVPDDSLPYVSGEAVQVDGVFLTNRNMLDPAYRQAVRNAELQRQHDAALQQAIIDYAAIEAALTNSAGYYPAFFGGGYRRYEHAAPVVPYTSTVHRRGHH